jgi:hypothetical protein
VNLRQRIAAFIGLLAEAAMLLFPPWKDSAWGRDVYALLFSPYGYKINVERLEFQCAIGAILTIAVIVLLGAKKP